MTVESGWLAELEAALPVFGHRNWIVVADAAYPAHSAPGIATVVCRESHTEVLRSVLESVRALGHVSPNIRMDRELDSVAEDDAPGVSAFRRELHAITAGTPHEAVAHEEILRRLDVAARLFRVLILKTSMRIPYTSVFIELGCGYWSDTAEQRLRVAMQGEQ